MDIAEGDGWSISLAWLDADAPFSDLPGIDRTITLVRGPGFTLDIAGRPPLVVHAPRLPHAFDGGAPTQCRIAGPSRVLNVMTARGRLQHRVIITDQPVASLLTADQAVARFAVLLHGSATVAFADGQSALNGLDAVRLDGGATITPVADAVFATILIERSAATT